MATEFSNEEEHKKIMLSHNDLLWKMLSSVERIESTLIGNSYTNNKGLVHKVESHGELLEKLGGRVKSLEFLSETEEKTEKKTHSFWERAASWAAVIIALIAAAFSYKK